MFLLTKNEHARKNLLQCNEHTNWMCIPEKKNIEKPIVTTSTGLTGAQKYTEAQPKNSGKVKPNIGFQDPQSIFFFSQIPHT